MDLEQAIIFAVETHKGQTRKDAIGGTFIPYVVHPIEVMRRLYNWGIGDQGILVAALCHDMLEDCNICHSSLSDAVGGRVANIVQELTFYKSSGLTKEAYLETFARASFEALVIKIADRLCNVEDFYRSKRDYAAKYFHKADKVFAALNDRYEEVKGYLGQDITDRLCNDLEAVRRLVRS